MKSREYARKRPRQKGAALVLAVIIIIVVLLTGMALMRVGLNARTYAARTVDELTARTAADAGLTQAFLHMQRKLMNSHMPGNSWDNSTLPTATDVALAGSDGLYSYTMSGSPTTGFTIASTGTCMGEQRTVNALLTLQTPFTGIGVKEMIDIKASAKFTKTDDTSILTLRTNSTAPGSIVIRSWVTVPGDLVVGPNGTVDTVIDTKNNSVIEGSSYAASEEIYFPPIYPPTGLPMAVMESGETVTISSSGQYDGIIVDGGQKLIIDDGDPTSVNTITLYLTDDLIIKNNARMELDSGTALNLYLGANWEDKNSAVGGGFYNLNSEFDPATAAKRLRVYGLPGCESISLKTQSDFCGAIYAPDADLALNNTGDVYGAFVGNSFEMKNSSSFNYVSDLLVGSIDDPISLFAIQRWWED